MKMPISRRTRRVVAIALAIVATLASGLEGAGSALASTATASEASTGSEVVAPDPRHRLAVGLTPFVCFVITDGQVRCWGGSAYAQLGRGSEQTRATPASVFGLHDAVAVTAGGQHACALRAGGTVTCWGLNDHGQGGSPDFNLFPHAVAGLTGVLSIAAGLNHTCALLAAGTVSCWGDDTQGQVGQPASTANHPAPTVVPGVSGATAIAAGANHTCALLADSTVRCWGSNIAGQLGRTTGTFISSDALPVTALSGVTAIDAGLRDTCAVVSNGTVKCWGDNQVGELGNGSSAPAQSVTPVPVVGVSGAVAVSSGWDSTCALLASGQLRCWGVLTGHLGDGQVTTTATPVAVPGVTGTAIDEGNTVACVLQIHGALACWGDNSAGALGRGRVTQQILAAAPVSGNLIPGQVSVGGGHTCALTAAGTVQCWGSNASGQLGIGAVAGPVATPTTVPGLTGVISLSAGTNHTCAILRDGTARCWGDDAQGELGDGHSGQGLHSNIPVPVSGLSNAESISAGGNHTCAVKRDRTVACWGGNEEGQVGNGSFGGNQTTPYTITGFAATSVSAGSYHTCAVMTLSFAACWGSNGNGEIGDNTQTRALAPTQVLTSGGSDQLYSVAEIVARYAYSCALLNNGSVDCWGWNAYLSVGNADTKTAVAVPGLSYETSIGPSGNHGVHTCAVDFTGTATCWGANDQGQLGLGGTSPKALPQGPVHNLDGAVQVSVGFQDSCALLANGTVKCWGANGSYQLGSTATSPITSATAVGGFAVGRRATEVDAGSSHTCALVDDSTARCWGSNGSGRLGDGTTTNRSKPVAVLFVADLTAMSAGGAHTCALDFGGTGVCWGSNTYGQLGDGTTTTRTKPTFAVSGLSGAIAISAGGNHTCALLSNGTVKCWGLNSSGQLGDGTTTSRHTPVTVKTSSTGTLSGVIAISAGTSHTCALLSNGTARCWGAGANGRLGNGSTANKAYASTSVSGVTSTTAAASRFASISAGGAHTCARLANGTAKCWGAGGSGRLGNGSTADHSTPVTVSGLTSVAQVSAGGAHGCALLSNGTAKCWGADTYGQLGINSTSSHSTPVTVSGLAGATSISAGGNHTAATLATGSLRAWGLNTSGQVGDGTTTNRLTPRGVSGF